LQDFERAKAAYEKALKLKPGCRPALYGLAMAHKRLGNDKQSQQAMQQYKELQAKTDHDARLARGPQADIGGARRVLAMACSDAGAVYSGRRKLDRAEELWRRGADVDPNSPPAGSSSPRSTYRRARRRGRFR